MQADLEKLKQEQQDEIVASMFQEQIIARQLQAFPQYFELLERQQTMYTNQVDIYEPDIIDKIAEVGSSNPSETKFSKIGSGQAQAATTRSKIEKSSRADQIDRRCAI